MLVSDSKIDLDVATIQLLVADCALHLFISKKNLQTNKHNNVLLQFLLKELSIGEYDRLISDLIENTDFAIGFCKKHPLLFNMEYIYEANEDVLGLIYISCKNIGNRKATGSYYTSTKVVKTLINKLNFQESQKILVYCIIDK